MRPLSRHRRSAAVVAFVAVALIFLLGFTSLALDIGHGYAIKTKLQNTADAAALAGAAELFTEEYILKGYDPTVDIIVQVREYAGRNGDLVSRRRGEVLSVLSDDIVIGHLTDPSDIFEAIDTSNPDINAIEVTVRRDNDCNGSVRTFLAGVLGVDEMNISTSAIALYDDRFAGYVAPPGPPGAVLPLTIKVDVLEDRIANAGDLFMWDTVTQTPLKSSDGIGDFRLYPSGADPGNFGLLNINAPDQSIEQYADRVINGVTAEDLEAETGTDRLTFFDAAGHPTSYTISGTTGLKAELQAAFDTRVGDVIGYFVHDGYTGGGSNLQYNIVGMRFARIMRARLEGSSSVKAIRIQPVVYGGPGILTDPNAARSGGMIGSLKLIR